MLMFHDTRMGFPPQYFGFPTPTSCGNPYWTLPQPHWLGPFYPTMTDVIEDVHSLSPMSMQSDESTRSSNLSGYRSPESSSTNFTNYYEVLENRSSLDRDRTFPSINENKTDSLLAKYQYKGSTPEHQDKLTFECKWKDCDSIFTTMNLLSNHVSASHADINGGLFYCGWEGCSRGQKGFNARYKMLVHVRTHTNEKPHKCNQCDKSFSRAENLKIHTRSHSGEKPYICPVEGCNKAYSNSSDRFKHTRTHSVDKPYFCKIPGCQKRYTDPSSLRKHVKTYKHVELHPNVNSPQLNTAESTPTPTPYNQNRISTDHLNKDHNETNSGDRNASQYANDSYETIGKIENRYLSTDHRLHFSENEKFDLSSRNASPVCVTNSHLSNVTNLNSEAAHSEALLLYQIEENFIEDGAIAKNNANDDNMLNNLNISRVNEPLNLKRCHENDKMVYENGVLNLQKKLKTENNEYFVKNAFLEMPLDLSLRKIHYS